MASEYKYRFTNKATTDLDEILAYITNELCNAKAAKDFYNEVFKQIDNICHFPESGALIENEYLADKTIQRFLVDNYTVYYKCDNEAAIIYIIVLFTAAATLMKLLGLWTTDLLLKTAVQYA